MFEYLWLPWMATVAAIALSAILFKEFLEKRAVQIAVEGRADSDSATKNGTVERAARTCTSPRVNETATSSGYDYEVFLNFRGLDARAAFTDFLYTSLVDAGIRTYKHDEDLRKGEEFSPELLQAIKQSKISIPIFSKGYASSVWCLKELVQMVECQKTGRQKIIPIFYDVAPSEVRHQTEGYAKAFLAHENKKRHDEKTIQRWKDALSAVGAINGWDLHSKKENRREGEFARELTKEVFSELKKAYLVVSDCLVSVNNHVDAIMEMIGAPSSETRIIGIHGLGGIGKTTVAKIIYDKLLNNFEGCCFLSSIREMSKLRGIEYLQNQLISDILKEKWTDINNIDEGTQAIKDRLSNKKVLLLLDDLEDKTHMDALVGKRDWFGTGSKLIITTRKKDVLNIPEVDCIYEVNGMNPDQSLQLFSKHAFKRDYPLDEYINQSNKAIYIAGGLPLALEVIGSLLSRTKKEMWDVTLEKLANVPHVDVQSKLKISYDALDDREKHIFLDIACFFIGYDKDIVVHFWDENKFFPKVAMEVLESMSLIKINEKNQVWINDQLKDLGRDIVRQESNMKIEKQSRVWNLDEALSLLRRHKGKKKVEALRLKMDHQGQCLFTYEGFESLSNLRFLQVDSSIENFFAEERLLWHESPSNVLPTNVSQENPDLLPQLRWLSWHRIPPTFKITNLSLEKVVILDLSDSEITHAWLGWSHIKVMKNLKVLDLSNCRNLQRLPDELGRDLASLEYLSLERCRSLERLPDSIGNLESLIELDISGTTIKELPDSIWKLKNLKKVKRKKRDISKEVEAKKICNNISDTERIHVKYDNYIYKNQSLRSIEVENCGNLVEIQGELPQSLEKLKISSCKSLQMLPNLSSLNLLQQVDIEGCPKLKETILDSAQRSQANLWENLQYLRICGLGQVEILPDLSNLNKLKCLQVENCDNLVEMQDKLPQSLEELKIFSCKSLQKLPDLSSLKRLQQVDIEGCTKLKGKAFLDFTQRSKANLWANLRYLRICGLEQVEILPDLSNLNKLRHLQVENCGNLVEIQGELPHSLKELEISSCEYLQKLPDWSSLKGLQRVRIDRCRNLNVEAISWLGSKKSVKFVGEDDVSKSEYEGEDDE